jgi:toxin-antitoxin system PIN domain toxin
VIAVDTNILVYAHREDSPWHDAAKQCVRRLAESSAPWAIPWPCLHEFFSVTTHPRIYAPPTPPAAAAEQIDAWLESPTVALLTESAAHWSTLRTMLLAGRVAGPRVHDARIAALCVQHAVDELWTADRDFGRFPQLAIRNPLIA